MKLVEFDGPPGSMPNKSTETFDDKQAWIEAMKNHGADEFLKEKEFNLDLTYALGDKGARLKGTWSDTKNLGIKYRGKKGLGLAFAKGWGKTKRSFYKA